MTNKRIYTILIILLAFGLFFQFLTLPMIKNSKVTKIKLEEKRAYLVERKKIIERIEELQKEYAMWQDYIEKLDRALPISPGITDILFQFQNFATDSGLVMKNFNYSEAAERNFSGANSIVASVSLVGSYSSLKSFAKKLENNLRITDMENIGFSAEAKAEKETEQLFSVSLSAKMYFFPQQQIASSK